MGIGIGIGDTAVAVTGIGLMSFVLPTVADGKGLILGCGSLSLAALTGELSVAPT
jgi:hypothetical protein